MIPGKPAADILIEAGIDSIEKDAPNTVEGFLQNLAEAAKDANPIRKAVIREEGIRQLKEKGFNSPATMIDSALKQTADQTAEDTQGRSILLREPDPWSEPVDGCKLLDDITQFLNQFLVLPPYAAEAMALWIIHTHALEAADISPILALTSPEKRCGKTRAQEVLQLLVSKPLPASNVTPSTIFRTVEKYLPTLLIDEADRFLKENQELIGLLNSGHRRSQASVIRNVGDGHEPRVFSTWCAKSISQIRNLPDTLEDRSITIPMKRKPPGLKVSRFRHGQADTEADPLRRKVARWVQDHLPQLKEADPADIPQLHDRANDNWHPLLSIADLAGGRWPELARKAALALSGAVIEADSSAGIQLLHDLRDLFEEEGADRLKSADIVEALKKKEDRPWPEWRKGQPITPRQLATLLKPFGVKPKQIWTDTGKTRGYERSDLEDTFLRYLSASTPPSDPVEPVEANTGAGFGPSTDPVGPVFPTGSKIGENPDGDCILPVLPDKGGDTERIGPADSDSGPDEEVF